MVQIRNLPDDVHRILKSRAAREGMSLSDYIKRELQFSAERPTIAEWLDRTAKAKPIPVQGDAVEVLRELRRSR